AARPRPAREPPPAAAPPLASASFWTRSWPASRAVARAGGSARPFRAAPAPSAPGAARACGSGPRRTATPLARAPWMPSRALRPRWRHGIERTSAGLSVERRIHHADVDPRDVSRVVVVVHLFEAVEAFDADREPLEELVDD